MNARPVLDAAGPDCDPMEWALVFGASQRFVFLTKADSSDHGLYGG